MLSDNQRRLICRLVFLLGCFAPTLGIVYWIFHRPTAADWARNIKAELGVDASIDSVETPWPGVTILRGVRLFDPEAGRLFEATELGIEFTNKENRVIINQNLALTNSGLTKLVQMINEHPIRRHVADRPWQVYLNGLTTIYDKSNSFQTGQPLMHTATFEQTHIELRPLDYGTHLHVRFQLADASTPPEISQTSFPKPIIEAKFARSHPNATGNSELFFGLETKGISLPCWLIGDLMPELKDLGSECRFEGSLAWFPQAVHPQGCIKGRFTQIDQSRYKNYGTFESIDLFCELNGSEKNWNANLVDRGRLIPIPFEYPLRIEYAIIAAQEDYYGLSSRYR
jgi:hypothetical protein